MKQIGNIIVADEGMELYKISDPKHIQKIALGVNDSASNWAERPEIVPEETDEIIPEMKSKKLTSEFSAAGAKRKGPKTFWQRFIIAIQYLINRKPIK